MMTKFQAIERAVRDLNERGIYPTPRDIVNYCDGLRVRLSTQEVNHFLADVVTGRSIVRKGLVRGRAGRILPRWVKRLPRSVEKQAPNGYRPPALRATRIDAPSLPGYTRLATRNAIVDLIDAINATTGELAKARFRHERVTLEQRLHESIVDLLAFMQDVFLQAPPPAPKHVMKLAKPSVQRVAVRS